MMAPPGNHVIRKLRNQQAEKEEANCNRRKTLTRKQMRCIRPRPPVGTKSSQRNATLSTKWPGMTKTRHIGLGIAWSTYWHRVEALRRQALTHKKKKRETRQHSSDRYRDRLPAANASNVWTLSLTGTKSEQIWFCAIPSLSKACPIQQDKLKVDAELSTKEPDLWKYYVKYRKITAIRYWLGWPLPEISLWEYGMNLLPRWGNWSSALTL